MGAYFRLQELKSVNAIGAQRLEEAIEIGAYRTLVCQVRIPVPAGTSGTLRLQHAAVLEEDAFVDVSSPTFDLAVAGSSVEVFSDLLRYVRWKVTAISTTNPAQFLIDIIARED